MNFGCRWFVPLVFVGFVISTGQRGSAGDGARTLGRIERLSPGMDEIVMAGAKIEVLADGFSWTEGPVWVSDIDDGCLLFSDVPKNVIFKWTESGGIEEYMRPSGYTGVDKRGAELGSNGLAIDPQGRLSLCEHGDRRVSVLTVGGGKRTLVDHYQGRRLNSPNDHVYDALGRLYFTDPPYGLPDRENDHRRELDFFGVFRLDTDGAMTLLTDELTRPNGIGLSPDEKTLYVAQSDPQRPVWMAYPIQSDAPEVAKSGEGAGILPPGRVLYSAKSAMSDFPGLPDGLVVSSAGIIFGSGPGGVYVLTPEGELLGRILTGGRTSNCTFGPEEKILYITADDKLCRIRIAE